MTAFSDKNRYIDQIVPKLLTKIEKEKKDIAKDLRKLKIGTLIELMLTLRGKK